MIRKDNGAGPILGTSMLTLRLALRHQNLAKGSVLLVCCRGLSPTVREGSVAIRAGALPHGRASASLVSWQHSLRTLPSFIESRQPPRDNANGPLPFMFSKLSEHETSFIHLPVPGSGLRPC